MKAYAVKVYGTIERYDSSKMLLIYADRQQAEIAAARIDGEVAEVEITETT